MNKTYTPEPLDVSDVELPAGLTVLTEAIARNVHEVWAAGRIADGWAYGEVRDDKLKLHPCLVPYEDLPESEKEFDRATAIASLKMIVKLGFRISRS